jgi:hypothetical protein
MIFDKDEAVTLVVGEEPGKYELLVHAGRISANSEFFKTALKREWLEGQTRTINMPADDWRTMTDYLNFAYSGELLTTYFTDPTLSGRPDRESCRLAKLYVLGKRLLDDVVHNAVGILLVDMYVKWATSDCLALATEADPSFLWDLAHSHFTKAQLQIPHNLYRCQKLNAINYLGKG